MAKGEIVHRRGLLQPTQQLEAGEPARPDQLRPEFLIEFIRELIKNNPNGDLLSLSLVTAARRTSATSEEEMLLKKAIKQTAEQSMWPTGFYSSV